MLTQASLQRRLEATALYQAADFGFAPGCWSLVQSFVTTGVQQIVNSGALDDDVKIALAEADLLRFVAEMMVEAQNSGLTELHENTYDAAKLRLCPLFPFC